VRTILDLQSAGKDITLEILARALKVRGIQVPATSTHISAMKGWLKEAGVFVGGRDSYGVDEDRLGQILGLEANHLDALSELDDLQRAFLKALARFRPEEWSKSNDVARVAESLYGVTITRKGLRSRILDACKKAGFIEFKKTTSGHGAKPHLVKPTELFTRSVLVPLLDTYKDPIGALLRELLRTPVETLIADLDSHARHTKGKALELLAIQLAFSADLTLIDWRRRASDTGGAEVDAIAEDIRQSYSRWQIQCKNGPARLDDIAKEVGVATTMQSNVVFLLTTRKLGTEARIFADQVMRTTNLQVILADGSDVRRILKSPGQLLTFLKRQSQHASEIKKLGKRLSDPTEGTAQPKEETTPALGASVASVQAASFAAEVESDPSRR
jgi:site-specific DNA-methyltransferase (cytosine-N4-specific)